MNALLILGASVVPENARGMAWSRSGFSFGDQHAGVILGASPEEAGYVDEAVKKFKRELAATPTTYEVARRIASRAADMADRAEATARSQAGVTLIGPAMYDVPREHIRWHQEAMGHEIAARDPRATPYERVDDLRKWAAECYRAMLTASQDAQLRAAVTAEFWSDVGAAVAQIPARTIERIKEIPGAIVQATTGLPPWAWSLLGVGGVGLLGFAAYKILKVAAPVAATHYLPARRT